MQSSAVIKHSPSKYYTIFALKMQPDFTKYDFCIANSENVSVISGIFDEHPRLLQYAYSTDTICRKGLRRNRTCDMMIPEESEVESGA